MSDKFRAMLAIDIKDELGNIKYPKYASTKLDGIRVHLHPKLGIIGRSQKPIKSSHLQKKFNNALEYCKHNEIIIDGELYCHGLTFQEISRAVMTEDFEDEKTSKKIMKELNLEAAEYELYWRGLIDNINVHMFEIISTVNEKVELFKERVVIMNQIGEDLGFVISVEQTEVNSKEEVEELFEKRLDEGYEGLILRDPESPYKFGRSTIKEEYMLKVKPFEDFDAVVVDVTERFINTNISFKNELGNSIKRNTLDAKESTGVAAAFVVKYEDHELKVSLNGSEDFRKEIWHNKESYIGKMVTYKGMLIGSKNVPRHPTFIRMRETDNEGNKI